MEEQVTDMNEQDFLDESTEFVGFFGERISRRRMLAAAGAAFGATAAGPLIFSTVDADELLFKSNLPYNANTSVKGHITFWHHWASPLRHSAIRMAIKQFNQYYKGVTVSDTAFPFGANWDKVRTAVAAHSWSSMPDVIVSDRPSLWNDARHKVYLPLTSMVKRDHVSGKSFWPFTWNEASYKGNVYGVPFETDVRVLFWNRAKFIDAGLNSNKGPKYWQDLPGYASKLDKKGSGPGGWETVTFSPYKWGNGAGLDTWVWDNRSDWQTSKQQPTINAARNIDTANWEKGWVDRYGVSTLTAVSSRNTDPAHNEFGNGFAAMFVHIPGQQAVMNYYGIQFTTAKGDKPFPFWGIGLLPYNKGGKPYSFSGGFSLSMPRNDKRSKAQADAAWEFMKFMAFVGQRTWGRVTNAIPTVPSIAQHDSVLNTTMHWKIFVEAMKYGHAGDRNFHDPLFPLDVVGPAQDDIMNGKKSAKDALDGAQAQALVNMKKPGGF